MTTDATARAWVRIPALPLPSWDAAVTKHHKPMAPKQREFILSQPGGRWSQIRWHRAELPLTAVGVGPSCLFPFLVVSLAFRCTPANPLLSRGVLPVYLAFTCPPFDEDTSLIGLGPTCPSVTLSVLPEGHTLRPWGSGRQHILLGGHSPIRNNHLVQVTHHLWAPISSRVKEKVAFMAVLRIKRVN